MVATANLTQQQAKAIIAVLRHTYNAWDNAIEEGYFDYLQDVSPTPLSNDEVFESMKTVEEKLLKLIKRNGGDNA